MPRRGKLSAGLVECGRIRWVRSCGRMGRRCGDRDRHVCSIRAAGSLPPLSRRSWVRQAVRDHRSPLAIKRAEPGFWLLSPSPFQLGSHKNPYDEAGNPEKPDILVNARSGDHRSGAVLGEIFSNNNRSFYFFSC